MPVSSYLVSTIDGGLAAAKRNLLAIENLTLGDEKGNCLCVAAYAESNAEAESLERRLNSLPGIEQAILVYHNFEDLPASNPIRRN